MQKCSREVQEVFLHALYAVTGTDVSRVQAVFQEVGTFDRAQEIVYGSPRQNPASRSVSENLVWCQILILMVLDADSRGPENFHGQNGIPKSVLIDMAFNVAHHVAKGLYQLRTSNPEDGDLDSDANIARRNWSVVGVLSRWHAVSVAGLDNLGTNEVATPEDRKAFGLVALQLARKFQPFSSLVVVILLPPSNRVFYPQVTQLLCPKLARCSKKPRNLYTRKKALVAHSAAICTVN